MTRSQFTVFGIKPAQRSQIDVPSEEADASQEEQMSHRHLARTVPTVWILVADRAAARIFSAEWPSFANLREIGDLVNPQGSMHSHDVYPDRFGQDHAPDGHGFTDSPETDFRHSTAEKFSQQIARHLEEARNLYQFGHLVVVSPPLMLGALRSHYSDPLKKLLAAELDQELIHADAATILEHVRLSLQKTMAV